MTTEARFREWLEGYKKGWVGQDLEQTLSMFTDDATYMYTPFHDLMRGKEEISAYIRKGAIGLQRDIEFSYEILAVTPRYGINRWWAALTWNPTGERLRFDGIYQVFLNEENLCYRFDEWWHANPPLPDDNAPD